MHLLVTQSRTLEEADSAVDLGQSAGDVVFLSFTDSDLGAVAAAAEARGSQLTLRLASLAQLKHPYSIDLYVERMIANARFVLVRLLGGLDYWRYGVDELSRVARAHGIKLALLPGDHREDARLDAASTLPVADLRRLWEFFQHGGADNVGSALGWIESTLGYPAAWSQPKPLSAAGRYEAACRDVPGAQGRALITFYRSMVLADDCAPIVALADALAGQNLAVTALYATSLKDPAAARMLRDEIVTGRPDIVVNTTAFSGRGDDAPSVLDSADAPVLQAILAGASEAQWRANPRGLGPADLAMNVVLPEMDGRLVTSAVSAKAESPRHDAFEFTRLVHRPMPSRVAFVAALAAAWVRLRRKPAAERRLAMVLSDYPGRAGREAYAVGLDTWASVAAICEDLRAEGYAIAELPEDMIGRLTGTLPSPACGRRWPDDVGSDEGTLRFSPDHSAKRQDPSSDPTSSDHLLPQAGEGKTSIALDDYRKLLAALPSSLIDSITAHWGDPADDPLVANGTFPFRALTLGNLTLALQPDRGRRDERKAEYHDAALPPRHAYVAFYLWLRHTRQMDALIHLGTHGTLEWLPGKPVALDESCAPESLLGPTPCIYPFIVNNPGEAAQAKRRNAALTLGHLTPPLIAAGAHGAAIELEALFDEYAAAETLDPKRAAIIARALVARARETGLAAEAGVDLAVGQGALVALDAWLCDIKEMRIRDGLHVFGRMPDENALPPSWPGSSRPSTPGHCGPVDQQSRSGAARMAGTSPSMSDDFSANGSSGGAASCAAAERDGLLAALAGRFVPGGPAGAPARGRTDVLPTGRNLYGTDPRAVPSRTAAEIGRGAADAVAERYAQDHGDWPRTIVLDLWASATMRTAGEDFAQALAHLGVRPTWDAATTRVSGFEILPFAVLERPRVDVTLRISGLFRDVFPSQIALFDQAVAAIAALDEDDEVNPLAATRRAGTATPRVFGSAPQHYGIGLSDVLDADPHAARETLGRAYLAAASHAYGGAAADAKASDGFAARVAAADVFVHVRDMDDADTLDAAANVEAEAGFAAAAEVLGRAPALYHLDAGDAERPKVRTQAEEIARVVRGRAANPRWIAGQMRHGHRGAAEIAETVDNLFAFAVMSDAVTSRQFDLLFAATCGAPEVRAFLIDANPDAARAIAARFRDAATRGLWTSRRNSDAAILADMLAAR